MRIQILTIFPEIFRSFLETSLIQKAIQKGALSVGLTQIRDFASPPHYQVDDTPYGGGAGMTMKPEPLYQALEHVKRDLPNTRVILMSPRGQPFNQKRAMELAAEKDLIFICGRYEGIDERFIELCVDEEISIGDFVVMGGEVPVMAVLESVTRLIPGVVGNPDSIIHESFGGTDLALEAPQYTRPPVFMGKEVPPVLLSGNHEQIAKWRRDKSRELTQLRRPDLAEKK